ncbi:hypothetical protein AOQ84DRAFT_28059 [Glonium stellatum]|uniref:Uncharacterized protein n=1 Tax=Glonium stellatum TaxID=574774 RepID=A0A8E2JTM7_9PEZI|nr:hypothetical protein AOQ84DRAFT_28059 [Glonium stellatum]
MPERVAIPKTTPAMLPGRSALSPCDQGKGFTARYTVRGSGGEFRVVSTPQIPGPHRRSPPTIESLPSPSGSPQNVRPLVLPSCIFRHMLAVMCAGQGQNDK